MNYWEIPEEPSIARTLATGYPWMDRDETWDDYDSDDAYEAARDERGYEL